MARLYSNKVKSAFSRWWVLSLMVGLIVGKVLLLRLSSQQSSPSIRSKFVLLQAHVFSPQLPRVNTVLKRFQSASYSSTVTHTALKQHLACTVRCGRYHGI
ncbi:hypothetical protein OK016_12905 [Vibrio chagasii]|nr:hypothetical protein [Vibrio chagasii]